MVDVRDDGCAVLDGLEVDHQVQDVDPAVELLLLDHGHQEPVVDDDDDDDDHQVQPEVDPVVELLLLLDHGHQELVDVAAEG